MDILDRLRNLGRLELRIFKEAADEIASLRAELEDARVDAERYKWILNACTFSDVVVGVIWIGSGNKKAIDAAIDAAMTNKTTREHKGEKV